MPIAAALCITSSVLCVNRHTHSRHTHRGDERREIPCPLSESHWTTFFLFLCSLKGQWKTLEFVHFLYPSPVGRSLTHVKCSYFENPHIFNKIVALLPKKLLNHITLDDNALILSNLSKLPSPVSSYLSPSLEKVVPVCPNPIKVLHEKVKAAPSGVPDSKAVSDLPFLNMAYIHDLG